MVRCRSASAMVPIGFDLPEEAVGSQADERLVRCGREVDRLGSERSGARRVARRPVPTRPQRAAIRLPQDAPAPAEPPVVGLEPGSRDWKVAFLDG